MAQGYKARKDESIAMRVKKPRTKKVLSKTAVHSSRLTAIIKSNL